MIAIIINTVQLELLTDIFSEFLFENELRGLFIDATFTCKKCFQFYY